jgi:transposase
VRFLEAFVGSLDRAALGFRHAQPAAPGRPAYHPGDLLTLYIYGYMHRMRASRQCCYSKERHEIYNANDQVSRTKLTALSSEAARPLTTSY